MYLFKKLFGGTSSKKGASHGEQSGEAPHGKKSMKNPTYAVEKIERSKLPSVEDLKAYYEEHGIVSTDGPNRVQTMEIPEVEEPFKDRTDQSKRINRRGESRLSRRKEDSRQTKRIEESRPTKRIQVAVVCPTYQNLPKQTSAPKSPEQSGDDQSSEPQYANAQELAAKILGKINAKDSTDYQNLNVKRQSSETPKQTDDTNIYQNVLNIAPVPPPDSSVPEEDSDYEVAVVSAPTPTPKSPVSPQKPAKPKRPPLPSAAALRNTEYFRVMGNFKQNDRKTCPNVLEKATDSPFQSGSPLSGKGSPLPSGSPRGGRKLPGRLNSETSSPKTSSPSTLRKAASMNDLAEEANDYLVMRDKLNRKLFFPGKMNSPKGSKDHVREEHDTDDSEDYLDMSENNQDIGKSDEDDDDKDDYLNVSANKKVIANKKDDAEDDKDDYLDMSQNNKEIGAKSHEYDEDDKDDYIPMILDDNDT